MPKKHKEFIILINIDLLKIDPEVTLEQFLGLQNVGLNILWKVKKMNFLAPEWYRNETAIVSFKAFWNWYALSKKKKKISGPYFRPIISNNGPDRCFFKRKRE